MPAWWRRGPGGPGCPRNGPRLGVSESMRHIEPFGPPTKPGRRYPAAGVRLWAGRPVIYVIAASDPGPEGRGRARRRPGRAHDHAPCPQDHQRRDGLDGEALLEAWGDSSTLTLTSLIRAGQPRWPPWASGRAHHAGHGPHQGAHIVHHERATEAASATSAKLCRSRRRRRSRAAAGGSCRQRGVPLGRGGHTGFFSPASGGQVTT